MASARVDPSPANFFAALFLLVGLGVLLAWLVQARSPRLAPAFVGLLLIVGMICGYGLTELVRWQTLVAALRSELGSEYLERLVEASAGETPSPGRGLTPAQRERIRSAPSPRRLWTAVALAVIGSGAEILFAWVAWRVVASPGLFLLACCAIVVTSGTAGYAAATARWQPLTAALENELDRETGGVPTGRGQDGSGAADSHDRE